MDSGIGKTIHQRNKSSPALSMAAANMAKATTKRTAFGDLSNISNQVRPSKDDSAIPSKQNVHILSKPVPAFEKKPAPLNKPAQRPISVSNIRNLLSGNSSNNSTNESVENAIQQQIAVQPANTRKVLIKRSTTIFKDSMPPLETVPERVNKEQASVMLPETSIAEPLTKQDILPEVLTLPPIAESKPVSEPVKERANLLSESSLPGIESVTLGSDKLSAPVIYEDALAEPVKHSIPTVSTSTDYNSITNSYILPQGPATALPPATVSTVSTSLPTFEPKSLSYPVNTEIEEYWEEEEETPVEEEGYVTARSFRSKGENTTGGHTTVLFPQINQRIRKEIRAATEFVEATRNPEEVEDELYDTSMVAEYGEEIFEYMREQEVKMLPNAHYMDNQHEIQWSMRSVLMDWLVQVHHRFNLLPETLFLTVNYIDRFLSCKVVSLGKLQLVGATAIFIASKYEEINCPSIQEIVYMVDNGYSVDELLKAERFMLTMLSFELGWPGPMSFLRRISKADDYDLETRTLAKYFLEVTIMDERFIGSPPSFAAAASHCLARLMLRKGDWVR